MNTSSFSKMLAAWCLSIALVFGCGVMAVNAEDAGIDVKKISDMTGFNPATYESPTGGDTLKIGLLDAFSGPGAGNGQIYWMSTILLSPMTSTSAGGSWWTERRS